MSSTDSNNGKLFSDFPPVSTADWEAVIQKDLKGADYDRRLVWRTGEGFAVRPYYRKADGANDSVDALPGEFPYVRGNRRIDNRWEIRQEIDAGSVATANNFARRALDGGAGAVEFVSIVRPDAPETVQGVPIQSYDDFKQVLQGLELTGAQVHWRAGWNAPVLLAYLSAQAGHLQKIVRSYADLKMHLPGDGR